VEGGGGLAGWQRDLGAPGAAGGGSRERERERERERDEGEIEKFRESSVRDSSRSRSRERYFLLAIYISALSRSDLHILA
jgi:hypothetical protein